MASQKPAYQQAAARIQPPESALYEAARRHLDNLTKPPGSLGRLEDLAAQLYAVGGGKTPMAVDPARIYTIAGDHGVASPDGPGVSPFPQDVTRQMVMNFLQGGAGVNAIAGSVGAQHRVVDAGCLGEPFPEHPNLIQRRVADGTANFLEGPAMSLELCEAALDLGVELANEAAAEGVRTLMTGEMGIGNTTPSTALYCAYHGLDPVRMTGPGAGLDANGVSRKAQVVRQALEKHADVVASQDPVAILAALGGYEIAALAGLIIGGAANEQLTVVDGFISTAALCAAARIAPDVRFFVMVAHASAEPGHRGAVESLGLEPLLHLGMRLGEGTGAALALPLYRAAAAVFEQMATFDSAGVSRS